MNKLNLMLCGGFSLLTLNAQASENQAKSWFENSAGEYVVNEMLNGEAEKVIRVANTGKVVVYIRLKNFEECPDMWGHPRQHLYLNGREITLVGRCGGNDLFFTPMTTESIDYMIETFQTKDKLIYTHEVSGEAIMVFSSDKFNHYWQQYQQKQDKRPFPYFELDK